MAKKKESGKLTAADMANMMSRIRPHRTPGGPPGTDWTALQEGYEAGRLEEVGPKAADWDRVPRRKRELELERMASTRAYPELNYGERVMENRGGWSGEGSPPAYIDPGKWADPNKDFDENLRQFKAEVYGPDFDPRYSERFPVSEFNSVSDNPARLGWRGPGRNEPYLMPMKPPGRYGDISEMYMWEKEMPRVPRGVVPTPNVPDYYGPSPYPDRMTDREKFMDMLSYFMESTGGHYPPPSKSSARSVIEAKAKKALNKENLTKDEIDAFAKGALSGVDWIDLEEEFSRKHGKKK